MLLGGLDETVWPPQARADAFLNRPMRAALGLTPPERKLGQTAHDFTQAMGRGRVILSRAQKRGGAPTVASRFLQRLAALGDETFAGCALRGRKYVELARLDRPPARIRARRSKDRCQGRRSICARRASASRRSRRCGAILMRFTRN